MTKDLEKFFESRIFLQGESMVSSDKFERMEEKMLQIVTKEQFLQLEDMFTEILAEAEEKYYKRGFEEGMSFIEQIKKTLFQPAS